MRLYLRKHISLAVAHWMGVFLGLVMSVPVLATPIGVGHDPVVTTANSFTNSCGLLPPVLTPSSSTVVQGMPSVLITATGCPGGIIQYFGSAGVGTIAPGGTISVPTNATGVMIVSALCSFSGCTSDASVATVTVKPSVDPNLSPVVSTTIATQTATVGTNYIFQIPANTFTDPSNDPIKISVSGLPSALTSNGPVIYGPLFQPGSSVITVTATNSSGYTANTNFTLNVAPGTIITSDPFAITAVTPVSCATLTTTQRLVTFNPQYSGLTGQLVTFSVFNEYNPTTNPGPYTLKLFTDNPTIKLEASQAGTSGSVSFLYNWLAACAAPTTPFAITAVTTVSCTTLTATKRAVTFTPQYAGLTGQPVTFSVFNEMLPTTAPGPYTLNLFIDNPTVNLQASQLGTTGIVNFSYNWLAACGTPGGNTAPTVANTIPNQTATVNQPFSYVIPANTFTDAQTPGSLTLSVTNLPTGLSFTAPATISGTPSTTVGSPVTVTVKATDPGSLSVSTSFAITVNPTSSTVSAPFAITGVTTVSCATVSAGERTLTFTPQYAGLTGQPVTFAVVGEMVPTTAPGPYTLRMYTDNPRITLQAVQAGSPSTSSSFIYEWLATCGTPSVNTAPTVANTIPNQTATVNQPFSYVIPSNTFTDAQTPGSLTLAVTNLPAGLSFTAPATISGTPSTTVGSPTIVTVKATDPGSLSVSTTFAITVNPASSSVTAPFSITGVTTVSCATVSAGERRLTFTPRYAGITGQPVTFSVVSEMLPTTAPGPYTLRMYTDNPRITLKATQAGSPSTSSSFVYEWLAACSTGSGRLGATAEEKLTVHVFGNPTSSETVDVEIRGAVGEPLRLQTLDGRGQVISQVAVEQAGTAERMTLRLGHSAGMYFIRATTPSQKQVLKVIKQ